MKRHCAFIVCMLAAILSTATAGSLQRIAVNCGGPALSLGNWEADSAYCTSIKTSFAHRIDDPISLSSLRNPAPAIVYTTMRMAREDIGLVYRFRQCRQGMYTVRLHAATLGRGFPPCKVTIEGRLVLQTGDYNGSEQEGLIAQTDVEVGDTTGLDLTIAGPVPSVCGIEVIPWDSLGPVLIAFGAPQTSASKSTRALGGTTLTIDKKPLSGVTLTIAGSLRSSASATPPEVVLGNVVSDKAGQFSAPELTFPLVVYAQKQGYVGEELWLNSPPKKPAKITLSKYARCPVLVTEEKAGAPLAGICIAASTNECRNIWSTSSSSRGLARLECLPPGTYQVTAAMPGFLEASATVRLKEGANDTVRLVVGRGVTISGRVVSSSEKYKPLDGARVVAHSDAAAQEAQTGKDGRFTISGLPRTGVVRLDASKPGYAQADRNASPLDLSRVATLTEKQTTLALIQSATLTVNLLCDFSIENRDAALMDLSDWSGFASSAPVKNKRVVFDGLTPGRHKYTVTVDSCAPSRDTAVNLLPSKNATITLRVSKGFTLSGVVLDKNKQPIDSVSVHISEPQVAGSSYPPHTLASTDADSRGKFAVHGLRAGIVSVSLRHPLYVAVDTTITMSGNVNDLEIHLARGASISGRVTSGKSRPVEGARCELAVDAPGQPAGFPVLTGRDGTYRFTGLRPAQYFVSVTAEGFAYASQPVKLAPGASGVRADFALDKGLSVGGRVVQDGLPLAGCTVVLTPSAGANWSESVVATADGEGRFEVVGLKEAQYDVRVQLSQQDPWPEISATVTPPASGIVVQVEKQPEYMVTGKVTDDKGRPLEAFQASVAVTDRKQFYEGMVTKDFFDGSYSLRLPGTGLFMVYARAPGFPGKLSETFDVVQGRSAYQVNLRLTQGKTIEGQVVDESGNAIGGAAVTARTGVAGLYFSDDAERVLTDARGRFRFTDVDPVTTELTAEKSPYITKSVTLDNTGSLNALRIVLAMGGTVEGHVYDDKGTPMSAAEVFVGTSDVGAYHLSPFHARTSDAGFFRITAIPAGAQVVIADAIGVRTPVTIVGGKTIMLELRKLAHSGTITGTLTLGGVPFSGAMMELDDPFQSIAGFNKQEVALIDGRFVFEGVGPGVYALKCMFKNPFGMMRLPDNVTVRQGEQVKVNIDLPGTQVRGRIMDGDANRPLANFAISLNDRDELYWYGFSQSGADGTFGFSGMQPGNYVMHFNREATVKKIVPITIAEGQKLDVGDVVIRKGRQFICKVNTSDGQSANGNYFVYSKPDGSFVDRFGNGGREFTSFLPLDDGEYLVVLGFEGYLLGNNSISLGKQTTVAIDMKACKPVKVVVQDSDKKRVEGACVYLKKKLSGMTGSIAQHPYGWVLKTDQNGEADLKSYFEGAQTIVVGHPAHKTLEVEQNLGNGSQGSTVTVVLKE